MKGEVASRHRPCTKCPMGEAVVTAEVNSMECSGYHSLQSRLKMRSVSQKQERNLVDICKTVHHGGKKKKEKEKIRRKDVLAPTEKPRGLTGLLLEPRVALNSSPTQLDCHILF